MAISPEATGTDKMEPERKQLAENDFYAESSCCAKLARSPGWHNKTGVVTCMFVIWMAIDTDNNAADNLFDANVIFQAMTWIFFLIFAVDVVVRVGAMRRKIDAMKSGWLMFDVILLLLYLAVLIPGRAGRILFMLQVVRIFSLVAAVPELMILLKGMFVGARSVFFGILLLIMVVFFFGLLFTVLAGGTFVGEKCFPNVPTSMYTLVFKALVIDGLSATAEEVKNESAVLFLLLVIYLLIGWSIVRLVFGVMCEVVSAVSATEKDVLFTQYMTSQVMRLGADVEASTQNGEILKSAEGFQGALQNPRIAGIFRECGLNPEEMCELAPVIFKKRKFESIEDLMKELKRLTEQPTYRDILELHKAMKQD